MNRIFVLATVVGLAVGAGVANAQLPPPKDDDAPGGFDRKFVLGAASGGLLEVISSDLALKQGTSDDVKQFAKMMLADHTKANKELMTLAGEKGVKLPKTLLPQHQAAVDKLSKLSGADFDRAYARVQVDAHKEAVALFSEEAKNGKDADLRGWAEKTLPTLKEHLSHALKLGGDARDGGEGTKGGGKGRDRDGDH